MIAGVCLWPKADTVQLRITNGDGSVVWVKNPWQAGPRNTSGNQPDRPIIAGKRESGRQNTAKMRLGWLLVRCPMSDERSRREALLAAQGSLRLEGLSFSKKGLSLMESWVAGDIDSQQLRELMHRLWSKVPDESNSSLPR